MNMGLTAKQWAQQEELFARANKIQINKIIDMAWKKLDTYGGTKNE